MATNLERLQLRTGESNATFLGDLLETAKNAILSRRYPFAEWPTENGETYVEDRYLDLQFRIALDLYNKIGAEGETRHAENGITREYESSWISEQLLKEVVPFAGVPT